MLIVVVTATGGRPDLFCENEHDTSLFSKAISRRGDISFRTTEPCLRIKKFRSWERRDRFDDCVGGRQFGSYHLHQPVRRDGTRVRMSAFVPRNAAFFHFPPVSGVVSATTKPRFLPLVSASKIPVPGKRRDRVRRLGGRALRFRLHNPPASLQVSNLITVPNTRWAPILRPGKRTWFGSLSTTIAVIRVCGDLDRIPRRPQHKVQPDRGPALSLWLS